MRRFGLLLFLVVAVLGSTTGAGARTPGWMRFTNAPYGITFVHPTAWRPAWVGNDDVHYLYTVVDLTTVQLPKKPCTADTLPNGDTQVSCALGPPSLPPGGVFVRWTQIEGPLPTDASLSNETGAPTRVGGLRAKIVIDPTGGNDETRLCPRHSTGSVTVTVAVKLRHYYWPLLMSACADTGDFAGFEADVLAMLRSVSFRI